MKSSLSRFSWCFHLAIPILLFAISAAGSFHYLRTWKGDAQYYQRFFGAAVMFALDRGYVNPVPPPESPLARFLDNQSNQLAPQEVPADIPTESINQWQGFHIYAMMLVGVFWRLFGISWQVVHMPLALLFGASIALSYGVFRLAMGRLLAFIGALIILFAPGFLFILPEYRDFSKAPFVLGILLGLGWLLKKERTTRQTLLAAIGLGLLMGIGLGFRQDLLSAVPVAVVLIGIFLPGTIKKTIGLRIAAAAVLLAAFLLTASPVLNTMKKQGANSFHFFILGLTSPFNANMALGNVPYEIGYPYQDEFAHTLLASYAYRQLNQKNVLHYLGPEYDSVGKHFFLHQYLRHMPADFVARWFASIRHILKYAPFAINNTPEDQLGDERLAALFQLRWKLFGPLCGAGLFLTAAALSIISLRHLRLAFALSIILLYFAGLPSLQFFQRHYFHLEIFFWLTLGFLVQRCCLAVSWAANPDHRKTLLQTLRCPRQWMSPELRRAALFAAAAAIAVTTPLVAARLYQSRHMENIYAQYANAPKEPMEVLRETKEGEVVFRTKTFPKPDNIPPGEKSARVQTGMLVAQFLPDLQPYEIRILYSVSNNRNDFRQPITIPARRLAGEKPIRVFITLYESSPFYMSGERRFDGIYVPAGYAQNFVAFERLTNLSDLPMLLNIRMTEKYADLPKYLTWAPAWRLIPLPIRAHYAYRYNLLPNGGFEHWDADGRQLDGAVPPGPAMSILRETQNPYAGKFALRETWRQSDLQAQPLDRFQMAADGLEADAPYELFLQAKNISHSQFALSIWQIVMQAQNNPKFWLLHPQACSIEPNKNYQLYTAQFQTMPANQFFSISLAPVAIQLAQPNESVVWDDWRLVKAYGELDYW